MGNADRCDVYGIAAKHVEQRCVNRRKLPHKAIATRRRRFDTLAREQHDGRVAEESAKRGSRRGKNRRTAERASESTRKALTGDDVWRDGVDGTGIAVVPNGGHDQLDEIAQVNPRKVLAARSNGSAGTCFEGRKHLRER